jgi:hypothetical protein
VNSPDDTSTLRRLPTDIAVQLSPEEAAELIRRVSMQDEQVLVLRMLPLKDVEPEGFGCPGELRE